MQYPAQACQLALFYHPLKFFSLKLPPSVSMLCSKTLGLQAPRTYPIPSAATAEIGHSTPDSRVCSRCSETVWTTDLVSELHDIPIKDRTWTRVYHVDSSEIRNSVVQGCSFCRSIADGVHGQVFLYALYDRWNSTKSWPSESSDEDLENRVDGPTSDFELGVKDEGSLGWTDASTFDDEFYEDDATGGWNAYEDTDTLKTPCNLSVTLAFTRDEKGMFSTLNVRAEATEEAEKENQLSRLRGERAVNLRYQINSEICDAETSLKEPRYIFSPSAADRTVGSPTTMRQISDWVRSKLINLAPIAYKPDTCPRRLIDVGASGLRVVDYTTASEDPGNVSIGFVALSYVWGLNQTFVLTTKTNDKLELGFELRQLPQTIQDAVIVTRAIGLRYLWVDALCILQDSSEDKSIELPKMGRIYENAVVTLIAAVARSATEGFLHYKRHTSYSIAPIRIPYPNSPTSKIVLSYPAPYDRRADPVNLRAWTFQELLLSRRAILFSYRGIDFVDRAQIPPPDGLTSGRDPQLPNLPWFSRFFSVSNVDQENLRSVWLSVRGEYSRRNLSYAGDKLLAISAVAAEIGQGYGSRYLAGLWEKDLESDLKWTRADASYIDQSGATQKQKKGRPKEYVAPSWSWASIESPVDDFHFDGEGRSSEEKLGFKIIKTKMEHAIAGFEYGSVTSGRLHLLGRVVSFFWRPHSDQFISPDQTDGFLIVKSGAGDGTEVQVGETILDAFDDQVIDGCIVYFIAMGLIEPVLVREEVEGLLLLPTGKPENNSYRRIGFAKVQVKEVFDDVKAMDIVVI